MAANGLMYTVSFGSVSLPNAATGIFEISAASCAVLIHSIRVTFIPTITSGIAQDVRLPLQSARITTLGSGGSATTPRPVNSRNTLTPSGTYNTMNTTPGTTGNILDQELVSVIVPFERIFTPDQRIVVPQGTFWALKLSGTGTPAGSTFVTSGELYVEEI